MPSIFLLFSSSSCSVCVCVCLSHLIIYLSCISSSSSSSSAVSGRLWCCIYIYKCESVPADQPPLLLLLLARSWTCQRKDQRPTHRTVPVSDMNGRKHVRVQSHTVYRKKRKARGPSYWFLAIKKSISSSFFFLLLLPFDLSLSLSLHASKERIQYTFIRIWFDNLSSSSCYYILRLALLLSAAYKTVFRYWTRHLLSAIFSLECDSWLLVIAVAVAASVFYIVFVLVVAERLFHYFRETTSRPSCCCCCCCCV